MDLGTAGPIRFSALKIMIGGLHSLGASDNILLYSESIDKKKGNYSGAPHGVYAYLFSHLGLLE